MPERLVARTRRTNCESCRTRRHRWGRDKDCSGGADHSSGGCSDRHPFGEHETGVEDRLPVDGVDAGDSGVLSHRPTPGRPALERRQTASLRSTSKYRCPLCSMPPRAAARRPRPDRRSITRVRPSPDCGSVEPLRVIRTRDESGRQRSRRPVPPGFTTRATSAAPAQALTRAPCDDELSHGYNMSLDVYSHVLGGYELPKDRFLALIEP